MLTLIVLPGIMWSASYRPAVNGCGEHDGLVIAADVDVSPDFQRRALIEEWNKGRPPDRRATLVEFARSTDATRSQLSAALDAGSCAYDVLLVDVAWLPEYARRGFLLEVENSWMESPNDFVPQTAKTAQWQGLQYAVPWFTDAGLLYVRQGTKTPNSWNELLSRGYAAQLKDYEGLTVNVLEIIWNTQEQVLSDAVDGVDERTAQVVLNGLDKLASASADAKKKMKERWPRPFRDNLSDSRAYAEEDSVEAFVSGDATLMRNWPYAFRMLTADPRVPDSFVVTNLPGAGLSVLGGWNLAVSAHSKHEAEAGALIHFLTSKNAQRRLFSCGGFTPSRNSAFEDPKPCSDKKYRPEELPPPERFTGFANTLKAALYDARPRPVTPYYAQFSETFRGCVIQVLDAHDKLPGARRPTPKTLADALTAALNGQHGSC